VAGPKRPLINTEPVSEFGAAMAEDFADPATQNHDLLYVPGFSDLRYQRDIELREYAEGSRLGKDVSTLPGHAMWVSVTKGAGDAPSSAKQMRAVNDGYYAATTDMVGKKKWLTKMPPGARTLPTGEIVNAAGDLMLMFADAPVARRNQVRKARAAEALVDGVGGDLGQGAEGLTRAGKQFGIETTVERQPVKK
jgi:hypothetical protein